MSQRIRLHITRAGLWVASRLLPETIARRGIRRMFRPRRPRACAHDELAWLGAERLTFPYFGQVMRGYAWGQGPLVLLVHGWESCTARMLPLVTPLMEAGLRVIAFDAPAHGASPGEELSLHGYGQFVRAVLTQFGPARGVVGHSFGAAAAAVMLGRHPRQLTERLVLMGAPTDLRLAIDRFGRELGMSRRSLAAMKRLAAEDFSEPLEQIAIQNLGPRLRMPGLIVHDRDDPVIPFEEAQAALQAWPRARLLTTTGLGHRRILSDPLVLERVAAFLASTPAGLAESVELEQPNGRNAHGAGDRARR